MTLDTTWPDLITPLTSKLTRHEVPLPFEMTIFPDRISGTARQYLLFERNSQIGQNLKELEPTGKVIVLQKSSKVISADCLSFMFYQYIVHIKDGDPTNFWSTIRVFTPASGIPSCCENTCFICFISRGSYFMTKSVLRHTSSTSACGIPKATSSLLTDLSIPALIHNEVKPQNLMKIFFWSHVTLLCRYSTFSIYYELENGTFEAWNGQGFLLSIRDSSCLSSGHFKDAFRMTSWNCCTASNEMFIFH